MGEVRAQVKFTNLMDEELMHQGQLTPQQVRTYEANALIDTGAVRTVLPVDVVRRLPPPPPDCENVVIGGHFVLLNRKTNIVVDIFHFE